ncbi:MAG TPA: cyclopropane-fatty-acyl-phospholipid synthase family protein [Candidatus Saccharimonadales bacterium]|nr:cyclopropane-fatty-acyl-phospholipid synthase family protein [Candidatus Saccharimonadales bacterium]
MYKTALDKILRKIRNGAIKVTYWDGTEQTYGVGEPLVHVTIKDKKAVRAMLTNLSLGFGECYMNGLIDVDGPIDQINRLATENKPTAKMFQKLRWVKAKNINVQQNQRKQVSHHYDIGNDFYHMWLDKSMTYSCAYFRKPSDSLEQAQAQKVDHLLRKLQLNKGDSMLDIGSGWGTLLIQAAKNYGVTGLGITLSHNQQKHSTQAAKAAGVDKLVKFELINYQELAKRDVKFDRIISVGMYEHVGRNNHGDYFKAVDKMLKDKGISVLHSITHTHETAQDPWIDKYIFPGGYIPSVRETIHRMPTHNFQLIDYENLRIHYSMTLDEWLRRFEEHKDKVLKMYDEKFYRMWRMYLGSASAAFRYGDINLSQFVFTKGNNNDLPLTREHLYLTSSGKPLA